MSHLISRAFGGLRFWPVYVLVLVFSSLLRGEGQYQINRYTIGGGGRICSGGTFTLTGTIGQSDAQTISGGNFKLAGGFQPGFILPQGPTYTGPHYDQWLTAGSPACWCADFNPRQCHGDVDGAYQGDQKYWVSTNDLDILISAWNKPLSSLSGNQICADFDHLPQGQEKYRVSTNDLDILIANWNLASGPAPDCP